MLSNDLFFIRGLNSQPAIINTSIELNPQHKIFEGHFPGQPVLPGVCMIQIIKEVLALALGYQLQLKSSDHIKFLSMVDPRQSPVLELAINYTLNGDAVSVTATLTRDVVICLKMKGVFEKKNSSSG